MSATTKGFVVGVGDGRIAQWNPILAAPDATGSFHWFRPKEWVLAGPNAALGCSCPVAASGLLFVPRDMSSSIRTRAREPGIMYLDMTEGAHDLLPSPFDR